MAAAIPKRKTMPPPVGRPLPPPVSSAATTTGAKVGAGAGASRGKGGASKAKAQPKKASVARKSVAESDTQETQEPEGAEEAKEQKGTGKGKGKGKAKGKSTGKGKSKADGTAEEQDGKTKKKKKKGVGFRMSLQNIKNAQAQEYLTEKGLEGKITIIPPSIQALHSMVTHLIERVGREGRICMEYRRKNTLVQRDVKSALSLLLSRKLDPTLYDQIMDAAEKAVNKFLDTKVVREKRTPSTKSAGAAASGQGEGKRPSKVRERNPHGNHTKRAGTFLSVARVRTALLNQKFPRLADRAVVFLCGAMDCIFINILKAAIHVMARRGQTRIYEYHIADALREKPGLYHLFPHPVRGGGLGLRAEPHTFPKSQRMEIYRIVAAHRENNL